MMKQEQVEQLDDERMVTSRAVFEGRLLTLTVDEVELGDGRRATREVVHHPGAVAIAPLLGDGRMVLVRQYRHPAGRVLLEIPAGTLAPGETPEACAHRELIEETGYRAGKLEPLFACYLAPGYSTELIRIFVASVLQPAEQATDEDETVEVVTYPLDELRRMIRDGRIQDAKTICAILALAERR